MVSFLYRVCRSQRAVRHRCVPQQRTTLRTHYTPHTCPVHVTSLGCSRIASSARCSGSQQRLLRVRALLPPAGLPEGGRRRTARVLRLRAPELPTIPRLAIPGLLRLLAALERDAV